MPAGLILSATLLRVGSVGVGGDLILQQALGQSWPVALSNTQMHQSRAIPPAYAAAGPSTEFHTVKKQLVAVTVIWCARTC